MRCCGIGCVALLLWLLMALPGSAQESPAYIWLEGEKPAAVNLPDNLVKRAGWGHKEFLSGDTWLQVSLDENSVDRDAPQGGIILRYDFETTKSGSLPCPSSCRTACDSPR